MSTTAELVTHRAEAGARFASAVIELRAAYGDLAAIEKLLNSPRVAYGTVPTFGEPPAIVPLRHPTYSNPIGSFADDLNAAYAIRYAAWPTAD
jgi:hypothetical protein